MNEIGSVTVYGCDGARIKPRISSTLSITNENELVLIETVNLLRRSISSFTLVWLQWVKKRKWTICFSNITYADTRFIRHLKQAKEVRLDQCWRRCVRGRKVHLKIQIDHSFKAPSKTLPDDCASQIAFAKGKYCALNSPYGGIFTKVLRQKQIPDVICLADWSLVIRPEQILSSDFKPTAVAYEPYFCMATGIWAGEHRERLISVTGTQRFTDFALCPTALETKLQRLKGPV